MPQAPKRLTYKRAKRLFAPRPHSADRGYDGRWRKFRLAWLKQQFAAGNVLCSWCGKPLDGASKDIHVDHVIPHKNDPALMYDPNNLAPMHARCHSEKTCQQDGGFGRKSLQDK